MSGPDLTVDVVVIGAGPVGENAADYAHRGGLDVALVEAELVGGECSFWACIPSKALLRTGNAVAALRRLPGTTAESDSAAVLDRRTSFTHDWDDSSQVEWARDTGLRVVRGRGRLSGEREVTVTTADGTATVLAARHAVVVATGSVPTTPPLPGIDGIRVWGSRDATSTKEVPPRLGVLGGGVVGCELAQAFARLGSRVTMVVRGPQLLSSMPDFAGERVAAGLRADGVDLRLDASLDAVSAAGQAITLQIGDDQVVVDELLLATGRRPATGDLGIEVIGRQAGEPLEVDDTGLVTGMAGEWLYAVGDVTGQAPLTHQGKYAARIAGAAIAARAAGHPLDTGRYGEHAATADHTAVPQVVFTDPEVASVGSTTDGDGRKRVRIPIAVAGSALLADGYDGEAELVVDTARDVLVGATFVGQDVAELLHAATIAVVAEVPMTRLWHAVPAFPTVSEVWLRLLETYRG